MERSANLLLHFADENLEPSASRGLNAFVDYFTEAMKRNTGSQSGPPLIENAPRDGGFLILEEDTSGKNDIARWASEAGGWVRENGEPIKITPSYWHPIKGENYLQHGKSNSMGRFQSIATSRQKFGGRQAETNQLLRRELRSLTTRLLPH